LLLGIEHPSSEVAEKKITELKLTPVETGPLNRVLVGMSTLATSYPLILFAVRRVLLSIKKTRIHVLAAVTELVSYADEKALLTPEANLGAYTAALKKYSSLEGAVPVEASFFLSSNSYLKF